MTKQTKPKTRSNRLNSPTASPQKQGTAAQGKKGKNANPTNKKATSRRSLGDMRIHLTRKEGAPPTMNSSTRDDKDDGSNRDKERTTNEDRRKQEVQLKKKDPKKNDNETMMIEDGPSASERGGNNSEQDAYNEEDEYDEEEKAVESFERAAASRNGEYDEDDSDAVASINATKDKNSRRHEPPDDDDMSESEEDMTTTPPKKNNKHVGLSTPTPINKRKEPATNANKNQATETNNNNQNRMEEETTNNVVPEPVAEDAGTTDKRDGDGEPSPEQPKTFTFDMEIKVQIIQPEPKEREQEIRRYLDELADLATEAGIEFQFGPKGGKQGPFVKKLGSPAKAVRFGKAAGSLPKLDAYTSGWAATKKAASYTNSNLPFSCKSSVNPEKFYARLALKALNRDIELQAKRFRLQNDNVAEVAAIAPASASLDATAISLWFLHHHNVYVNLVTAKVNRENHTWKEEYFASDEVDGVLCVCADDDLLTVARLCKDLWPVKGRHRDMSTYPAGVKASAFLFDGAGKIHRRYRERFSTVGTDGKRKEGHLLYKNMREEYQHSRRNVDDNGGRFTAKLLRNVDSLTAPITRISDGKVTCLREFISSTTDPETGKKMFSSMKPAPTKGNKNGVLTVFTTYRAGNATTRRGIAERAKDFLTTSVVKKVWSTFGADEAQKVFSNNIYQRMQMDQGVLMEDVVGNDDEFVGMECLMDRGDDSSLEEMSTNSAWAANSAVTTQSTRDRLAASQQTIQELTAAMSDREQAFQEQQHEQQKQLDLINNLEQQTDAIRAEKDSTIADLMRRLEAATTGGQQGSNIQSNQPVSTREKPVATLTSRPRRQTRSQPADSLPEGNGALSCVSPEKADVGGD